MKYKVYVFYDSKTESFGLPFYAASRGEASRIFSDIVADRREGNRISSYPEDFTFFEVGEYDVSSGEMFWFAAKVSLGLAVEYKRIQEVK